MPNNKPKLSNRDKLKIKGKKLLDKIETIHKAWVKGNRNRRYAHSIRLAKIKKTKKTK